MIPLLSVFAFLVSAPPLEAAGFAAARKYKVDSPRSVAVGDFNGDAKRDLAVASTSNKVSILLGTGIGTFEAAVDYAVGTYPNSVAVGDFNGDAKQDLAVANSSSNNVSVLLGNGNGTFQAAVNYAAGTAAVSVAVADFNGDAKQDLAVANAVSNNVSILLGNGNGTFQAAVHYAAGTNAYSVAVADFNGDAQQDLAVANGNSATVSILLGNGNGTFQAAVNYGVGPLAYSVAVGDFNGDAKQDLAVANFNSDNVSILLGNGNGTFQAAVNYGAGTGPLAVVVADFNGDAKQDLAVANQDSHSVSILLGNGNGSFQAAVHYGSPTGPVSVAAADFNGDAKQDLAVANNVNGNVSILRGNGNGTFQVAVNYGVGNRPVSVAVGDFNGDAKRDLAVANEFSDNVSILLGDGNGTFQAAVNYGVGRLPHSVAVGDFNGDAKQDLAVANSGSISNNVSILLGNGNGTFQAAVDYGVGTEPNSVAVGDFNGDAKQDLAVANAGSSNVSILLGNGNGTFQAAVNYGVAQSPRSVAVGDFNGDAKQDLAVASQGLAPANNVSILLGNGNGTFQAAVNYTAGTNNNPYSVAVGDFNTIAGDAKQDLAVANPSGTPTVSILLGQGNGTFQAAVDYAGGGSSVAVGDFNGDGNPDLAVTGGEAARILLGNGNGTFQAALDYAVGSDPNSVAVGDFDADQDQDLAVANSNSNNVSILLNTCVTPTAAVTSSVNPSSSGQSVTFTATVTSAAGTPTGSVAFKDGAKTLAVAVLSGGNKTFTTSTLTAGSHSITAVYAGDASFCGCTSPVLIQTVTTTALASTTTGVSSSTNPSSAGQSVTFTATVGSSPTPGGPPSGTVTFKDGTTTLGTGTLSPLGGSVSFSSASFTTSALSAGIHSITAVYAGDNKFAGSASAAIHQTVFQANPPTIAINDVTANEGNSGVTNAVFTVSLSAPYGQAVSVNFATNDGTASGSTDFTPNSGSLTFNPGSVTATVSVGVTGDTTAEPDESFSVVLSAPVNATLAKATGTGTIADDDFGVGGLRLFIDDRSVLEGSATNAGFRVTLSAASTQSVTVNYSTADGTATAPSDYETVSGTLTFTPGRTQHTIIAPIVTDSVSEGNETFLVNLSGPTNATMARGQALGTIGDPPAPLHAPMYRAYNPNTDYHFFTTDLASKNFAVSVLGFRDESTPVPFYVSNVSLVGSVPLFRLYNPNLGRHYYTAGTGNRDFLLSIGMVYEKDEGFIYPIDATPQPAGTTELFRLYNNNSGTHLFTADAGQKNAILALFPGVWVEHTSVGLVFTSP